MVLPCNSRPCKSAIVFVKLHELRALTAEPGFGCGFV